MRTVYVVKGSEDGNLGVYGNLKKAFNKAIFYGKSIQSL